MKSFTQFILMLNKAVKLPSTRLLLILWGGGLAVVLASCLRAR